jgi:hypothetical protein
VTSVAATGKPGLPSLVIGALTYVYLAWVLFGIGRELRTADRAFWLLVGPVLLLFTVAGALLPGVFAGRPGAIRWMRRLYLAGGFLNLWIGNLVGTMLVWNGGSYWDPEVVAYLAAGVLFLAGHHFLRTTDPC